MRLLFAAVAAGLLATATVADDPKPKKPAPTLKAGDKAPAFRPTHWLHGAELPAFEPGKVYVVEFWATWCGPCVAMMPHLADLQDEYKAKGVTVVGFSSVAQDKRDSAEKFVARRAPKLGYAFAWGDTPDTHAAWMTAAGQGGIPCSFVVDKDGTIAYIGHPMFLDLVLPRVLAGTWDRAAGKAEMEAADKEWDAVYAAMTVKDGDPAAGLRRWAAFAAEHPTIAAEPHMGRARLDLLVRAKRFAEAKALAEGILAAAVKRDDDLVPFNMLLPALSAPAADGDAGLAAVRLAAAEACVRLAGENRLLVDLELVKAYRAADEAAKSNELGGRVVAAAEKAVKGDTDWAGLMQLARTHQAVGDTTKAKATAERLLAAAAGQPEPTRQMILREAKKYGAEPKADK